MKILSWNCRGLGNPQTVQNLLLLVKDKKSNMVFLMETKLVACKVEGINRRLGWEGCFVVDLLKRKGGLALLWCRDKDAEILNYSQHHINATVMSEEKKLPWLLTGFYGHPEEKKYTWSNKHIDSTFTKERLDRAVANFRWSKIFCDRVVEALTVSQFDHKALLLCLRQQNFVNTKKRRVFRFEAKWIRDEEGVVVVERGWRRTEIDPNPGRNIQGKMNGCKGDLIRWSKSKEKEVVLMLKQKTERLKREQESEGPHNVELIRMLQEEMGSLLEQEDLKWRQRAKRTWYQLDKEGIEEVFYDYFNSIFCSTQPTSEAIEECLKELEPRVTKVMNTELHKEFTKLKVEEALKHMGSLKSPGPDGYGACFYQAYWSTVGEEAKESTACHHSSNQSIFIPGRLITDNVMIAYESLHTMKTRQKGRIGSMALKLDMSKAYNRIEWRYVEAVMRKLGFGDRWVSLIMRCTTSVTYSILVNGEPGKTSKPTRGIRQRDPISLYLFILCAERLPQRLCKELASLLTRFWLGHKQNEKKIQWRSWFNIGESKSNGGLGFRDFECFNKAMLAKQCWRMLKQPDSLVAKIMKEKYFKNVAIVDANLGYG
ncbi:uncharacterized protein LOC121246895 [Juglans microcarpa x Juglans regia]|uniref:uncharacterized protein LOC121246895 n=1 Tax=Juglans microcarpa x Juglans regia TaxID=2249226 RepID=UPI001B7E6921|nr:uncharacterized protein LOC121246895 [Juglans microcarpa x Juglans regia]